MDGNHVSVGPQLPGTILQLGHSCRELRQRPGVILQLDHSCREPNSTWVTAAGNHTPVALQLPRIILQLGNSRSDLSIVGVGGKEAFDIIVKTMYTTLYFLLKTQENQSPPPPPYISCLLKSAIQKACSETFKFR